MVLGGHVEVLRWRVIGDKVGAVLNANIMPRAVKVARSAGWNPTHLRVLGSTTNYSTCRSVVGWAGRISKQGEKNDGANDPETRESEHSRCTSEK